MSRIHEALVGAASGVGLVHETVSPESFPELADSDGFGHGLGPAFDDLAVIRLARLRRTHDRLTFLAGGGSCLHQLRWLQEHDPLTPRGTLWFSSHFEHASRVLMPEYEAFGVKGPAVHSFVAWRARAEQEISDFVVVPSTFCEGTYPDKIREKIHVAEFGVDCEEFTQPTEGRSVDGALEVLFPATNPMRKGLRHVLNALQEKSEGETIVHVTGNALGMEGQWRNFPGAKLNFHGWINDEQMKKLYRRCHVLLLPSLEEGQALAALEGMASGMALIATPNVGVPFEDGNEGLVVQPSDAESIARALAFMLENRREVTRMGREARAFAEKRPWSKFQQRIVQIMQEAR